MAKDSKHQQASTNTKDEVIDKLLQVAKDKRKEIEQAEKPNWRTNCSFGYRPDTSERTNLQIQTKVDTLVDIMAFLIEKRDGWEKARSILVLPYKQFTWQGFTYDDWYSDIISRINKINIAEKKKELDEIEGRLNKLVSPERREQMELEALQKMLA